MNAVAVGRGHTVGTWWGRLALMLVLVLVPGGVFAQGPSRIIRHRLVATYEQGHIEDMLASPAFRSLSVRARKLLKGLGHPRYAVRAYSVDYRTRGVAADWVVASGLALVPLARSAEGQTFPMLSYQHAPIFERDRAPSNPARCAEAKLITLVFATRGTIVSMPDYLGLGRSSVVHPYLHASSEALASLDMLRATRQLCEKLGVQHDRLFLTGYSQGGHATMALQRLMESKHADEFTVTASAPMAGPYNLTTCWKAWLARPVFITPAAMARLVVGCARWYGVRMESVFRPKLDVKAATLLDGRHPQEAVVKGLPPKPQDLFLPEFLAGVASGRHPFRKALVANSVVDWTPRAPTRLYHARKDEVVPFRESEAAAAVMGQRGATVWVMDLGDMGHVAGFVPGLVAAKKWFDSVE